MRQWLDILLEFNNTSAGASPGKPSLLMKLVYLTSRQQVAMGGSATRVEMLIKALQRTYSEEQIRKTLQNPMFKHSVRQFPDKKENPMPEQHDCVTLVLPDHA